VRRGGHPLGMRALDAQLRCSALRAADRVLVPGQLTAGLFAERRISAERTDTVPSGAEPRPRAEPPSGSGLLSVARLVPRKGIDTVICAMRTLPSSVEYRVVGSGPDEHRLRQLATVEGVVDRVHFLGRLDDRALADEYRRCAIFVLPARRTSLG